MLASGYESYVKTEMLRSQVQEAEIGFVQRLHSVTNCDKARIGKNPETRNDEQNFQIERSQLQYIGHVTRMLQEKLARRVQFIITVQSDPGIDQGPGESEYVGDPNYGPV